MNRQARRTARKQARTDAAKVASVMASTTFDYTPDGELVQVTNPKAVAALTKAFTYMLQNGCEPHVTKITDDVDAAFPRSVKDAPKVQSYLAVGLDKDGRGTYSVRKILTPGFAPSDAENLNRRAALDCLTLHTDLHGFPAPDPRGNP